MNNTTLMWDNDVFEWYLFLESLQPCEAGLHLIWDYEYCSIYAREPLRTLARQIVFLHV